MMLSWAWTWNNLSLGGGLSLLRASGIIDFEDIAQGLSFDDENYIGNLLFRNLSNLDNIKLKKNY